MVEGFSQKQGIDFDKIFSPVVKMSSIRVVLRLVASLDLELQQLDVKIAFLHGDLKEEIYMDHLARGIQRERERTYGLQVKEEFVWLEANFKTVVQEV